MQILRLLASRRAASTIIASPVSVHRNDEEAFFDLDFSSSSVCASSSSSGSLSFSDSDDECTVLDFIISLQRTSSASSLIGGGAVAPLNFCASDPLSKVKTGRRRGNSSLRTLSFGARKDVPVPLYNRPSIARSSSGRRSSSSARSLRLFVDSPSRTTKDDHPADAARTSRGAPSRKFIRRCLAKISCRIRTAASARAASARGSRGLRKCRSASSVPPSSAASRCDDSDVEKQDGIAGAIAHCKESLQRASTSNCDSRLLRSWSE